MHCTVHFVQLNNRSCGQHFQCSFKSNNFWDVLSPILRRCGRVITPAKLKIRSTVLHWRRRQNCIKVNKQLLNCRITTKNSNVFVGVFQKIKCFQLKFGSAMKSPWQCHQCILWNQTNHLYYRKLAIFDDSDGAQEISARFLTAEANNDCKRLVWK